MIITKKLPQVNAGSMADIAFLLLVFFLVTTTIQQDKGLQVSLPQWTDIPTGGSKELKNVLRVVITSGDQLFVNNEKFEMDALREKTLHFVTNNGKDPSMSRSPKYAMVLLTNDKGCSYNHYLAVSNEIYAAYNALWEKAAQQDYGRAWDRLSAAEQSAVKAKLPRVIMEEESRF